MANKIIEWFVGGIVTTLTIIVLLLAWITISTSLRQVSPNNSAVGQIIDDSDKTVNEVITWHQIIGGIEDFVFIVGLIFAVVYAVVKLLNYLNPPY